MWNQPGEDILAGIRICECTKLSNDHTLLCNGSHISICPDKPTVNGGKRENAKSTLWVIDYPSDFPYMQQVDGNVLNETIMCLQECFMQMCLVSMSQNLMSGLNMSKLARLC